MRCSGRECGPPSLAPLTARCVGRSVPPRRCPVIGQSHTTPLGTEDDVRARARHYGGSMGPSEQNRGLTAIPGSRGLTLHNEHYRRYLSQALL